MQGSKEHLAPKISLNVLLALFNDSETNKRESWVVSVIQPRIRSKLWGKRHLLFITNLRIFHLTSHIYVFLSWLSPNQIPPEGAQKSRGSLPFQIHLSPTPWPKPILWPHHAVFWWPPEKPMAPSSPAQMSFPLWSLPLCSQVELSASKFPGDSTDNHLIYVMITCLSASVSFSSPNHPTSLYDSWR